MWFWLITNDLTLNQLLVTTRKHVCWLTMFSEEDSIFVSNNQQQLKTLKEFMICEIFLYLHNVLFTIKIHHNHLWINHKVSKNKNLLEFGPRPPTGAVLSLQASDAGRKLETVKREDMLNLKVHTYSDMPGCVGFAEGLGQAVAKMHLVCKGSHAKMWCWLCVDLQRLLACTQYK